MSVTIGEILKKQRIDRKLTLDDAVKATHIRIKYLEALENNQFDLLPSPVQGRGYLRSYADFLELPATMLVNGWEKKTIDVSAINQASTPEPVDDQEQIIYSDSNGTDTPPDDRFETAVTPAEPNTAQPAASSKTAPDRDAARSSDLFQEVGKKLRDQRELLGLALNDIEQYTHIRHFYLQAIEDGRFQALPSPVHAKGMIESYAQFLDINADELMLRYAEGLQVQREEKLAIKNPGARLPKPRPRAVKQTLAGKLLTPDLLIGSIVIILLVVFAIWTTTGVINRRNLAAQTEMPAISELMASPSNASSGLVVPTTSSDVNSGTPLPATGSTEENLVEDQTPEARDETNLSTPEISPTILFQEDAPLQVYVVTTQRTFLRVTVDGETVFNSRTQIGNAYPFSGATSIELLSGNAAALQIIFNEEDLGTIGGFGQVVNLIFTEQGVITPTAQFTSTPTPTVPSTQTLAPTNTPPSPTVTKYVP